MNNEQEINNQTKPKEPKRKRARSPYLFPAYDFGMARQIVERVEKDGAGNLSEETLAIALHLSAKSSGFQLKTLTARQFGLLTKQGQTLSTTPMAKAILKPTTEDERSKALVDSFLAIPLFREIAARFKGQPLPQGQAFRNILEREFKIDSKRVSDAERVLMDSARETDVLVTSGSNTYLSTERGVVGKPPTQAPTEKPSLPQTIQPASIQNLPLSALGEKVLPIIEEEDLLELNDEQFGQFWGAFGEILRARARRSKVQKETNVEEEEKEESAGEDIPF
ncbi:hypothetical protein ES703_43510 [subsurface metagenome]